MNASNFHWNNRKHAAKQKATKTGAYAEPAAVREWDAAEAAANNRKTVEAINAYLQQAAGMRS